MRCPECGAVLDPKTAVQIDKAPHPDLLQIYCRADCVLDALKRGYPLKLRTIDLNQS